MFNIIYTGVKKISKILNYITQVLIAVVMVLMVSNIILRALLNSPIKGIYDILTLMYVILISFSLAYCGLKGGHVYVDFLFTKMSSNAESVCKMIMKFISFIFFTVSSWYMLGYAQRVKLKGKATMTLGIQHYPFFYIITLGIFLLAIVMLFQSIEEFKKVGEDK